MQRHRHLLEPGVLADNLGRAAPLRELFLQQDVLGDEAALGQRAFDEQQQVIGVDRLGEKIERAGLHGCHGVLNAAERGHHDHRQVGIELLGGPQHAEPIALGEAQIRQDDPGPARSQYLYRLRLVAGFDDDVPLRLEREPQHRTQRILVLDEQDRRFDRTTGH
jgi:hypothetical protein